MSFCTLSEVYHSPLKLISMKDERLNFKDRIHLLTQNDFFSGKKNQFLKLLKNRLFLGVGQQTRYLGLSTYHGDSFFGG